MKTIALPSADSTCHWDWLFFFYSGFLPLLFPNTGRQLMRKVFFHNLMEKGCSQELVKKVLSGERRHRKGKMVIVVARKIIEMRGMLEQIRI